MNILTQMSQHLQDSVITNLLSEHIQQLTSPLLFLPSLDNYTQLIERLGNALHQLALSSLKHTLEQMDLQFRLSPGRSDRYYVKQTRSRTILTLYGELTYRRTEYIDRHTHQPFCYVDRKLGFRKHERFDCCIQALVIETYSQHNSMIKVGQLIGDRIAGPFRCDPQRCHAWISRQSVYNILHRFKSISVDLPRFDTTPDTLYVMADEKFIPLQGQPADQPAKQMVKAAVIFEGRQAVKRRDGSDSQRFELVNKTLISSCKAGFWPMVLDAMASRYDLDKVKQIYLLGDGASWIKSGRSELNQPHCKVTFALDEFHFQQALHRLSREPIDRQLLVYYAYKNMKQDFDMMIDLILLQQPHRREQILTQRDYLDKNFIAFQTLIREVKMGCAMEQAISHILASVFTSVPKAYAKENLATYLNYRILQQNNFDLRNLLIKAMDKSSRYQDVLLPSHEYDFSLFESHSNKPSLRVIHAHHNVFCRI